MTSRPATSRPVTRPRRTAWSSTRAGDWMPTPRRRAGRRCPDPDTARGPRLACRAGCRERGGGRRNGRPANRCRACWRWRAESPPWQDALMSGPVQGLPGAISPAGCTDNRRRLRRRIAHHEPVVDRDLKGDCKRLRRPWGGFRPMFARGPGVTAVCRMRLGPCFLHRPTPVLPRRRRLPILVCVRYYRYVSGHRRAP